ncbi:hypothetical protein BN2537_9975 [Streptomyces venezuelae]|nr:hypothetical protein BN2537_9975 [Streptomyces venezuelae]
MPRLLACDVGDVQRIVWHQHDVRDFRADPVRVIPHSAIPNGAIPPSAVAPVAPLA